VQPIRKIEKEIKPTSEKISLEIFFWDIIHLREIFNKFLVVFNHKKLRFFKHEYYKKKIQKIKSRSHRSKTIEPAANPNLTVL